MNTIPVYAETEDKRDSILSDLPDSEHDRELLKGDKAVFELPEVKDIPGQEYITVMPLGEMADTTIASDDEEGVGILGFNEGGDDVVLPGRDEDNSIVIDTDEDDETAEDDDFIGDDDDDDEDDDDEEDEEVGPAGALDEQDPNEDFDESAGDSEKEMNADVSAEELSLLDESGPLMPDSDSDNLRRSTLDNTDWEGEPLNEVSTSNKLDGADLDVPGAELDNENEEVGEEDEENNLYSEADTE